MRGRSLINADVAPGVSVLRRDVPGFRDQFHLTSSGAISYLALNTRLAPFRDVDVRRAVVAGLDRAERFRLGGPRTAGSTPAPTSATARRCFSITGSWSSARCSVTARISARTLTADYLRRASDFVRGAYGGPRSDEAAQQTVRDFRTNRYDKRTGVLTP